MTMGRSHSRCYAVEVLNPGGSLRYVAIAEEEEKRTEGAFPTPSLYLHGTRGCRLGHARYGAGDPD